MPYKDPVKRKEYAIEYYRNRYKEPAYRRHKNEVELLRINRLRDWVNNYRTSVGCNVCSECHVAVLDFHHPGDDKEVNVSFMVAQGYRLSRIMDEVKKCEVLCANCHRKEHWMRRGNESSTDPT